MSELLSQVLSALVSRGLLPSAFQHAFMARALCAVVLIGVVFGAVGPLVTARRLAFFSTALAQSAMVGVAVGLLLGEPVTAPFAGLFLVTLLSSLWLTFLRRHAPLSEDTLVGVFLAISMAAGLTALVVVTRQFNVHQVEAVLFGSPLTVTDHDLHIIAITGVVVIVVLRMVTRPLLVQALDEGLALAYRPRGLIVAEYVFAAAIACAVVVSLRVVGALLVEALIVVPAAAARLVVRSWQMAVAMSVAVAVVAAVAGLVVSAVSAVPTGAAIVLVAGVVFVACAAVRLVKS